MYTSQNLFAEFTAPTLEAAKKEAEDYLAYRSQCDHTYYGEEVIVRDENGNIVYDSREPQQKQETSTFSSNEHH